MRPPGRVPASAHVIHPKSTTKRVVMSTESSSPSGAELVDEVSNWAVGGGMIVMALFPLALPILALTAIAVLPLLLPLLAIGLPIGIVALTIVFVRLVVRDVMRGSRPTSGQPECGDDGKAVARHLEGSAPYGLASQPPFGGNQ